MKNCLACKIQVSERNLSGKCVSCAHKGHQAWNKGLKGFMKGRKVSLETRIKQSKSQMGEKNHAWKGGKTSKSHKKDFRYSDWRSAVIQRDNSECTICFKFCMYPVTHHVKHSSEFPELRYDINNGKTLCYDCHMVLHKQVSYYRKRGEFSGTLRNETILSQSWEETSKQVQRIMAEIKEFYSSMSVMPTRAPLPKGKIYAELTGDCKK